MYPSISSLLPTVPASIQSPVVTTGGTREGSTKGKTSSLAAGGLLHTVLGQKGRLVSKKGEIMPSALPQNLLPLLGRGLSFNSFHGSNPQEHKSEGLKSPASAAALAQGSRPSQPPTTDTHSRLPHTQTNTPEPKAEITTLGTTLDLDTETPLSGTCLIKNNI